MDIVVFIHEHNLVILHIIWQGLQFLNQLFCCYIQFVLVVQKNRRNGQTAYNKSTINMWLTASVFIPCGVRVMKSMQGGCDIPNMQRCLLLLSAFRLTVSRIFKQPHSLSYPAYQVPLAGYIISNALSIAAFKASSRVEYTDLQVPQSLVLLLNTPAVYCPISCTRVGE